MVHSGRCRTVRFLPALVWLALASLLALRTDSAHAAVSVAPAGQPPPPVAVTVTDGRTSVQPGESVIYTITVAGGGTATTDGVVTDTLPAGAAFLAASDGGVETAPGVVGWPAFNLAGGEVAIRTVTVRVNLPYLEASSNLTNAVTYAANGTAPTPADAAFDIDQVDAIALMGMVWQDGNANGLRDGEEAGFEGAILRIALADGDTVTATTDTNGVYQAAGLPPGALTVSVAPDSLPAGVIATYDVDGAQDSMAVVHISSGQSQNDVNFGYTWPVRIEESRVWHDTNGDGQYVAGEAGLPGVVMTAVRAGADGVFGTSDDATAQMATDGAGRYGFAGLLPGRYQVRAGAPSDPAHLIPSTDPDGLADGVVELDLAPAAVQTGVDFGFGLLDLSVAKGDFDAVPTTGQTLTYRVAYTNGGEVAGQQVAIQETVPANTRFAGASSAPGWSCAEGAPAGSPCLLDLGPLAVGAQGHVTFSVTVSDAMPAHVNMITNTVQIVDLTPDRIDVAPTNNQAVETTPVLAAPILHIVQTDGGVREEPGATLVYTMTYRNDGNQNASGVTLAQAVPAHTSFNAGASTPGWTCEDGAPAGIQCTFAVGHLPAGASGAVTFAMTLQSTMPVNVASIDAVVTIYDDRNHTDSDGELTPVDATPDLRLDGITTPGVISPGEMISYVLTYSNGGNQDAIGVLIVETVPDHTRFDRATSSEGWDCVDGSGSGTNCVLTIGGLLAGQGGQVTFAVVVDPNLSNAVKQIKNRAVIAGSGLELDIENNQGSNSTPVQHPTAIDLESLTASSQANGVLIQWVTSAEYGSWGFILYRGTGEWWGDAVRITPDLIPAQGNALTRATYSFLDTSALPNVRYLYWLQELDLSGRTSVYGPVVGRLSPAVAAPHVVFLPLVTGAPAE